MSSHPYMPLYVGSYLKNTDGLTTEEHGAYLLILMALWTRGGELALDHKALARIARVTPKRWPRIWERIGEFFIFGKGYLRHERVDEELQKADQLSLKRKNAGAKGNIVKALKAKGAIDAIAYGLRPQGERRLESDHILKTVDVERAPVDNCSGSVVIPIRAHQQTPTFPRERG